MHKLLIVGICSLLFMAACSDDDPSGPQATNLEVLAEMPATVVSQAAVKGSQSSVLTSHIDSLRIDRLRLLISRMKLNTSGEDDSDGDRDIKTAPTVLTLDSGAQSVRLVAASIPEGRYDKIKFEFHRFSSSERSQYAGDEVFGDFATSDRYSAIIEGRIYEGGVAEEFIFYGDGTSNVKLEFSPEIVVDEISSNEVILQIDPSLLLKTGNSIIDPRDPKSENDIEKALRDALKALSR